MWVAGEAQRVRRHASGHLYFELVEKGDGDEIVGKLEAVLWRRDHQQVRRALARSGQEISEGLELRCRGGIDFYPPFGRTQLVVREVDPTFTLGLLAERRRQTLAALAAAGLLERNKQLELAPLPLVVALVTSEGSAAYHDFLSTLRESGFGFRVVVLHASVQGKRAEGELVSALGALAGLAVDCVALVRGGGSRTDLAVFDSRAVAEAVALAPVPVLTGLGHEIDESIADRVAHTALKTPTKVAEHLVRRLERADAALAELRAALRRAPGPRLERAREAAARAERTLRATAYRLAATGDRLEVLAERVEESARRRLRRAGGEARAVGRRIGRAAPFLVAAGRRDLRQVGLRLGTGGRGLLLAAAADLAGRERLCAELAPRRTLERGFTITRDGAGRAIRDPRGIGPGSELRTEWASGSVRSRVEVS